MSNERYDKRGNCIYEKKIIQIDFMGECEWESWIEYDKNNNVVYRRNINLYSKNVYECWWEFDKNKNKIHFKNSSGWEYWYKYNEDNERIIITEQEFKQIERTKLYFNMKRSNRFEIMDI